MIVNICGIPHTVKECEDCFDTDYHFGQIDYRDCVIKINKDMTPHMKSEVLCHEILHGIFVHLGYSGQSSDEQFVQALASAINQSFEVKPYKEGE